MISANAESVDAIFAILNSPSLMRYIQENQNSALIANLETAVSTTVAPINSIETSTQQAATETRSRVAAPFSPERIAVTRHGQRYHVDRDELEAAPVVHIPEQPVISTFVDDNDYVEFLKTVINNAVVEDPSEVDRSYRVPKNHNRFGDYYPPTVSVREQQKLIEDLANDPIPGLELEIRQLEVEPPIVTRSAARHRTSDPQVHSVPSSSTPVPVSTVIVSSSQIQTRNRTRISSEREAANVPSGSISSRTRQALAKTPTKSQSPILPPFKTPLPMRTVSPKTKSKVSHRMPKPHQSEQNSELAEDIMNDEHAVNFAQQKKFQEKFKNLGKKIVNVLEYENFSVDEKLIVKQLLEFTIEKFSDEQVLVLVDYILRLVALVCGHILVPQILPLFENATMINSGFAHLALGLLIHDKSPMLLQVAPVLYGKTKLLKRLRNQLMINQDPTVKAELIRYFEVSLINNDHPYRRKSPDLNSEAALMLQVTGEEGLMDATVLGFLPIETINNPEDRLAEMMTAQTKRFEAQQMEDWNVNAHAPGTFKEADHQPFPPVSNMDISRLLDGVLDNSNSFHNIFMQDSPGTPGNDDILMDNFPGPSQSPATHQNITRNPISSQVVGSGTQNRPRRIPLVSGPLIGSPARIIARRNDLSGFV